MNKIKSLREKSGLTQGQLGDIMGVTKQAVNCYEKGKSQPPYSRAKRAILALGEMGYNFDIDDFYPETL